MRLVGIVGIRAKGLLKWSLDPWPIWIGIGGPLVLVAIAWHLLPGLEELRIRSAGYAITVLGVLLVVRSIQDKTRLFGLPAIGARAVQWLRRLPTFFLPAKVVGATGHVSLGSATLNATGTVVAALTNVPTLEQRVSLLEGSMTRLSDRVTQSNDERRREVDGLRQTQAAEAAEREAADRRLQGQIKDLSVGSVDYEWVGVLWVILGNALTTFPAEIASVIQRM